MSTPRIQLSRGKFPCSKCGSRLTVGKAIGYTSLLCYSCTQNALRRIEQQHSALLTLRIQLEVYDGR